MPTDTQSASPLQSFIDAHRRAGTPDDQIRNQLLQTGWAPDQVNKAMIGEAPTPPTPVENNMTTQTSNAGTPLQVENVQYNMRMKPVQSKVGMYIRIAGVSLWFTVIFVCGFLTSLIDRIAGSTDEIGSGLIFTLSLTIVTVPIFLVAYNKFLGEQKKNPAANDDIFFKQSVRRGLGFGVVFGAIAAVVTLYQFLSTVFLPESDGSYTNAFTALIFTIGLANIVYFYWRLHAQTQR